MENFRVHEGEILLYPRCGSHRVVKRGMYNTRYEDRYMFSCNECKRKFSSSIGVKFPKKVIIFVLQQRSIGVPIRGIVELVKRKFKVSISPSSVVNWCKRFGDRQHIITGIRHPKEILDFALKKRKEEYTYRDIAIMIQNKFGYSPAPTTIGNWIRTYGEPGENERKNVRSRS